MSGVANPGSMTASCGRTGDYGFLSYTGAAASLPGESVLDLEMGHGMVVLRGAERSGKQAFLVKDKDSYQ